MKKKKKKKKKKYTCSFKSYFTVGRKIEKDYRKNPSFAKRDLQGDSMPPTICKRLSKET